MASKRDIRMKGFAQRTPVSDARQWIRASAPLLETEKVRLRDAFGRVLAADVVAPMDVPPFDRAAMDGFAVRAVEVAGATEYDPVPLPVVGTSLAGQQEVPPLEPNSAVRIMTGAPIPAGADAIVPAEFAREDENGTVWIAASVAPGKNVGRRGEDVSAGTVLLPRGRRLRPQDLGVLASVGLAEVDVVRQPRVRLLITGNELVEPGSHRQGHEIYDANGPMLAALVRRDGGVLAEPQYVRDDRDSLRRAIVSACKDGHIVLISGGSSVGSEDFAPLLVDQLGELPIHGVAIRPAAPTGIGRIGSTLVFLLPGNPVSCLCAYDFFANLAVRAMQGLDESWPYPSRVLPLAHKVASVLGRLDYCRVRIEEGLVYPLASSGASILTSTTSADGFVIVPESSEGFPPQTPVRVYLYEDRGESPFDQGGGTVAP